MKTIQLTQGKVALVDDEDYEYLNQHKWHTHKSVSGNFYACRNGHPPEHYCTCCGRLKNRSKQQLYRMHRVVLKLEDSDPEIVDHENGNGLDNQKHNLRKCTYSQNGTNKRATGRSKYLGVSFRKCVKKDRWHAQITKNGKVIYIGRYDTEEEAALAYNEKAKVYHGKFARLNNL